MAAMPKVADLLMVGASPVLHQRVRSIVEISLMEKDRSWRVASRITPTFEEATIIASTRPRLDVVFISNTMGLSYIKLGEGCRLLAVTLGSHVNKPWVTFDGSGFNFLHTIFIQNHVRVQEGGIDNIIAHRWLTQRPPVAQLG